MPPMEEESLTDKAVLWVKNGVDRYGKPTVAAPVEIDCRWVEGSSQTTEVNNATISIDAVVVVIQDIPIDSVMWKGLLSAFVNRVDNNLMTVVKRDAADDVRGMFTRRTVSLSRRGATLPTVV